MHRSKFAPLTATAVKRNEREREVFIITEAQHATDDNMFMGEEVLSKRKIDSAIIKGVPTEITFLPKEEPFNMLAQALYIVNTQRIDEEGMLISELNIGDIEFVETAAKRQKEDSKFIVGTISLIDGDVFVAKTSDVTNEIVNTTVLKDGIIEIGEGVFGPKSIAVAANIPLKGIVNIVLHDIFDNFKEKMESARGEQQDQEEILTPSDLNKDL